MGRVLHPAEDVIRLDGVCLQRGGGKGKEGWDGDQEEQKEEERNGNTVFLLFRVPGPLIRRRRVIEQGRQIEEIRYYLTTKIHYFSTFYGNAEANLFTGNFFFVQVSIFL